MDTAHWPQEIVVKPMEEIVVQNTTNSSNNTPSKPSSNSSSFERKIRPQKEASVNCPRCNSTNTKFCYYNNYSLSQPRYFCKTCRRYWTEGGTLRSIPVGGGSRKNKRSSSSSSSSTSSYSTSLAKKLPQDLVAPHASASVLSQNPRVHQDHGQDLNLGFPSDFNTISELIQVPHFDGIKNSNSCASTTNTNSTTTSALEFLNGITTTTTTTTRGMGVMNSFMPIPIPDPNSVYSSSGQLMIPMPEFKIPSLNFSLDGMGSGAYGNLDESPNGRLLFPFEDLNASTITTTTRTITSGHDDHHAEGNRDQNGDSNGFWNGMLGGGSW